jgi:transposase
VSIARLVITAVVLEGRSQAEVARDYGVSRQWVNVLVGRYRTEGDAAFMPRSRRPHSSPQQTPDAVEDAIVEIHKELDGAGHDAGAATIAFHLEQRHGHSPAVSTVVLDQVRSRPTQRTLASRRHSLAARRQP